MNYAPFTTEQARNVENAISKYYRLRGGMQHEALALWICTLVNWELIGEGK